MNPRGLTILITAWVLVVGGACGNSKSASGKRGGATAGSSGSNQSGSVPQGGSSGAGGAIGPSFDGGAPQRDGAADAGFSTGDAQTSADGAPLRLDASGRDGMGGQGGSTMGTGGSVTKLDAGKGPCKVRITSDPDDSENLGLTGLTPGDDRRLQVKGTIEWGTTEPATPTWQWTVYGPDHTALTTTDILSAYNDTTRIRFPLLSSGDYDISVLVTATSGSVKSTCSGHAIAEAGKKWPNKFFVRVLPPPNSVPNSGQRCPAVTPDQPLDEKSSNRWCPSEDALPLEQFINLEPGRPHPMGYLSFQQGTMVGIDPLSPPTSGGFPRFAIPSFIHIAPHPGQTPYTTWTIDGASSHAKAMEVTLSPSLQYDILVVPNESTQVGSQDLPLSPPFRAVQSVQDLQRANLVVTPGVEVKGTVRVAGGPLMGARVLLRANPAKALNLPLPSTWGTSDVLGAYSLRVRGDSLSLFSVIVIPPAGTTLPQVTIPECIRLGDDDDGSTMTNVDFTWNTLASTNLTITVMMADGQTPAPSVLVRLQSQDQDAELKLPEPGTLSINGVATGSASGSLRLEATTDKSGVVTFGALPRAGYHLVLLPLDSQSGAIATADLDLTDANNNEQRIFQIPKKVKLSGIISPKGSSSGGRILAIDTGRDILGNTISSTIDAEGNYVLMADPGRSYRFSVEPAPGKNLPLRIPLYGVTATSQDANNINRKLPAGLRVSGTVWFGERRVPDAIVQVYCQQAGTSGCMDPNMDLGMPTTTLPLPVVETITQADGSFTFYLSDPGSSH